MSYLCSTFSSTILPLIILAMGLVVAVLVYFLVKKRFNKACDGGHFGNNNSVEVDLKKPYTTERSMKFLEYLHRAMPKELIAFPMVGVDRLVVPKKDKVAYNAILSKYVDVCVFTRRKMEPVLVIDLVAGNTSVEQYMEMDASVVAVLKAVKLPVLHVKLDDAYDLETLRDSILNALPAKVVSALKENYIAESK